MTLLRVLLWLCATLILAPLYVMLIAACAYVGKIIAIQALFNKQGTKAAAPTQPLKGELNNGQKEENII